MRRKGLRRLASCQGAEAQEKGLIFKPFATRGRRKPVKSEGHENGFTPWRQRA